MKRLALGIRGIPVSWHVLTAMVLVPFLAPMVRLTSQEQRIIVLVLIPIGTLGTLGATWYRERVIRIMSRFLKDYSEGQATSEEFESAFAAIVNLPRAEVLLGLMLWSGFGFPIMIGLYFLSDTFVAASLMIFGITCISVGAVSVMFIFLSLKNFLHPWRLVAAAGVPDPEQRRRLTKRVSVEAKLSIATASLICAITFLGVSFSQTRMMSVVESLVAEGHRKNLLTAQVQVEAGVVSEDLFALPAPVSLDLGLANMLLVDRETGEIVEGDEEKILEGEIKALLDTELESGDSSMFSSENTFSWQMLSDGKHLLISVAPGGDLSQSMNRENLFGALWALFGVILAIIVARFQSRDITRSLSGVSQQVHVVSQGDLRGGGSDEAEDDIGDLARYIDAMTASLRGTVSNVIASAERVEDSAGSIAGESETVALSSVKQGESVRSVSSSMDHISDRVNRIQGSAEVLDESVQLSSAAITEMSLSGRALTESSDLLTSKVSGSSQAFEKMFNSIDRVVRGSGVLAEAADGTTSGIQEMAAALRQVDKNAHETAKLSDDAVTSAEQGHEKVLETIRGIGSIRNDTSYVSEVVEALGGRTEQIGNIVNVIMSVADETNLLALNAAIIAAQAGDHGRAFSVVADEIKDLADRVITSTKEITDVIQAVQQGSSDATGAMRRVSGSVGEGVVLAEQAGEALEGITVAARESGTRMQEVVTAVKQQSIAAQHVADLMTNVEEAVAEIRGASEAQDVHTSEVSESNHEMGEAAEKVTHATGQQEHSSQEIEAAVGRVSEVAKKISEALSEQIAAVQEVASQMDNVRDSTGENESSTKNMQESVESLIEEAGKLRDGVERFKV